MINLQRILLPTDFSEPSANAARYAKALAEQFSASLHVLYVIEDRMLAYWVPPEGDAFSSSSIREDLERSVREKLDEILPAGEREKYHGQLALRTGSPFLEIVRYAKDQAIDLIVMGTHGHGPVAHMLIGNVAEKVVRKAPCPVLTVRHPEHEFVMP